MEYLRWILLITTVIEARKDPTQRIVNGVPAAIELFPYTAQLAKGREHLCGGSLVSSRVIVTSAHCLQEDTESVPLEDLNIYLGSSESMKGVRYGACRAIIHPKYGNPEEDYFYDIALVLLTKAVKVSRRIQIAKIAPTYTWRNTKYSMTVAGFGATDLAGANMSEKLLMTRMQYLDSEICNRSQTRGGVPMPVPDHMFCMIGATLTGDCDGDSGSAVTWRSYIVGLVTLIRDARDGCVSEVIPSMYTDLTYFRDWVMQNVKKLESIPSNNVLRVT